MKTFSPKSSRISEIRYDDEEQILQITFVRGGTYEYREVSSETYWALVSAESIGKAFDFYIKKGNFEFNKLS